MTEALLILALVAVCFPKVEMTVGERTKVTLYPLGYYALKAAWDHREGIAGWVSGVLSRSRGKEGSSSSPPSPPTPSVPEMAQGT